MFTIMTGTISGELRSGAALEQGAVVLLERLAAAVAGRDHRAGAVAVALDLEAGVVQGQPRGRHGHLAGAVHAPRGAPVDEVLGLEARAPRRRCGSAWPGASKRVIGPAPEVPASAARHASCQPMPSGLTMPSPVTTTRRRSPSAVTAAAPRPRPGTAPVMKAARRRAEERDRARHVLGLAEAPQRGRRQQALALLVGEGVGEAGARRSRARPR